MSTPVQYGTVYYTDYETVMNSVLNFRRVVGLDTDSGTTQRDRVLPNNPIHLGSQNYTLLAATINELNAAATATTARVVNPHCSTYYAAHCPSNFSHCASNYAHCASNYTHCAGHYAYCSGHYAYNNGHYAYNSNHLNTNRNPYYSSNDGSDHTYYNGNYGYNSGRNGSRNSGYNPSVNGHDGSVKGTNYQSHHGGHWLGGK